MGYGIQTKPKGGPPIFVFMLRSERDLRPSRDVFSNWQPTGTQSCCVFVCFALLCFALPIWLFVLLCFVRFFLFLFEWRPQGEPGHFHARCGALRRRARGLAGGPHWWLGGEKTTQADVFRPSGILWFRACGQPLKGVPSMELQDSIY